MLKLAVAMLPIVSARTRALAVLIGVLAAADLGTSSAASQTAQAGQRAEDPKNACADAEQCTEKGCYEIANSRAIKELFQGVKADPACQTALYAKACDGGYADACLNAGGRYVRGEGVAKDVPRGLELWDRGCSGGASSACMELARAHYKGEVVNNDLQSAARYWDVACKNGVVEACFRLGTLQLIGGAQPINQAAEFYRKACEQKKAMAPGPCLLVGPRSPATRSKQEGVLDRLVGTWNVSVFARGGSLDGSRLGIQLRSWEEKGLAVTQPEKGAVAFTLDKTAFLLKGGTAANAFTLTHGTSTTALWYYDEFGFVSDPAADGIGVIVLNEKGHTWSLPSLDLTFRTIADSPSPAPK